MQQEKDYLQREIQKLTLFLTKLISKISGSHVENIEHDLQQTDLALQNNFGFSLFELINLTNQEFLDCLIGIDERHLDKISELMFESSKKVLASGRDLGINTKKLIKKTIVLLEHLDTDSDTFSMERMDKKNVLQQYL